MVFRLSELKKRLGQKSRRLRNENRMKVFLTIAKKPSMFSELLENKDVGLCRATLSEHLKSLKRDTMIYRVIDGNDRIVYKAKIDEVPEILMQSVMVGLSSIISLCDEDEKTKAELRFYAEKLSNVAMKYINKYRTHREQALKLEKKAIESE